MSNYDAQERKYLARPIMLKLRELWRIGTIYTTAGLVLFKVDTYFKQANQEIKELLAQNKTQEADEIRQQYHDRTDIFEIRKLIEIIGENLYLDTGNRRDYSDVEELITKTIKLESKDTNVNLKDNYLKTPWVLGTSNYDAGYYFNVGTILTDLKNLLLTDDKLVWKIPDATLSSFEINQDEITFTNRKKPLFKIKLTGNKLNQTVKQTYHFDEDGVFVFDAYNITVINHDITPHNDSTKAWDEIKKSFDQLPVWSNPNTMQRPLFYTTDSLKAFKYYIIQKLTKKNNTNTKLVK